MDKRIILSESEKNKILGMHKNAISKEWNLINEDATQPVNTNTQAPTKPTAETKVINDRDYVYKKEGDKYFFKLQNNPASEKAKGLKAANKYVEWTPATGGGLTAIQALNWGQSENMPVKSASSMTAQSPLSNTTLATKSTSTTNTAPTTATTTTATQATSATEPTTSTADQTTAQNTTQPRTGKEIRQDARQQKQTARQDARQGRKDVRQLENELKNLQSTYRRLQNKMTPTDKQSYEARINQIQTELGQA